MTKADDRKLTTKDLERVFGVSSMTLYLWRQGIATRSKLRTAPKKKGERSVHYFESDVRAWSKKHDVPMVVDPSRIKEPKAKAVRATGPARRTAGTRRAAA